MNYLVRHGNELILFIITPFTGLALEIFFSAKTIRLLGLIALLLLAPVLTGYDYIVESAYRLLVLVIFSCVYAYFSRTIARQAGKFIAATLCAALLSVLLGYAWFINAMGGSKTTEGEWNLNGYRVVYYKDQGFSGRPLYTYELSRYAAIPLFIKHIESGTADSSSLCITHFEQTRLVFDRCNQSLVKMEEKGKQ